MSGGRPYGALSGLRVLDLSQALAGPFCTQIFADHGAHVVKVEPLISGDLARHVGAFHPSDTERRHSGYFHSVNRNKKGIVIDLKSKEGREVFLRLIPQFDVLVENYRAGVMDRLGLSYEALKKINPKLVYGAIRGFGDPRSGNSPYVDWPAYDVVAQAMGGICGITGPDADHPVKIGPGVGDTIPALYLATGILAAVLKARETGTGQFVDVAMVDAVLAVTERIVQQQSFGGAIARAEGNFHPMASPFGIFPASDGYIAIAATDDKFFRLLVEALDAAHLLESPFENHVQRAKHAKQLNEAICSVTRNFSKAELMKRLGGKIPFGPVYQMDDIAQDAHFAARDMLPKIRVPGIEEPLNIAGVPIKFSETPGGVFSCGPDQGEHTQEILETAGFSTTEIAHLRASGAIL